MFISKLSIRVERVAYLVCWCIYCFKLCRILKIIHCKYVVKLNKMRSDTILFISHKLKILLEEKLNTRNDKYNLFTSKFLKQNFYVVVDLWIFKAIMISLKLCAGSFLNINKYKWNNKQIVQSLNLNQYFSNQRDK